MFNECICDFCICVNELSAGHSTQRIVQLIVTKSFRISHVPAN